MVDLSVILKVVLGVAVTPSNFGPINENFNEAFTSRLVGWHWNRPRHTFVHRFSECNSGS